MQQFHENLREIGVRQQCLSRYFARAFHRSIASQSNPFGKWIEHFSLNIIQHIHHFHQYILAIGSSILEIWHPKSHDRLHSKFLGWWPRVHHVRRMNSPEALLSDIRKVRSLRGQIWRMKRIRCSAQGIVIQKQSNLVGTLKSGIVNVNRNMSPSIILIRSKNFA
jgi:hypothetical protein